MGPSRKNHTAVWDVPTCSGNNNNKPTSIPAAVANLNRCVRRAGSQKAMDVLATDLFGTCEVCLANADLSGTRSALLLMLQ